MGCKKLTVAWFSLRDKKARRTELHGVAIPDSSTTKDLINGAIAFAKDRSNQEVNFLGIS